MREETVAQRSAPPSDPATRWVCGPSVLGRDAPQRFCRDRRARGLLHLIELTSGVSPTPRKLDSAATGEPVEAGIAVDLYDAAEPGQVRGRVLGLSVGAIEIDGRRRLGPIPGRSSRA